MAYREHAQHQAGGHHARATTYAPTPPPKARPTPGPCPPPEPEPASTCCDLVCFERPRYFCGHLLTDADLSSEQRYVVEKHKLYHRSLHGYGVVCGLPLTCDPVCRGGILVGEGFAIDDCGNDLVVCEPTPFDVIGKLREKKYLPPAPPKDPCAPERVEPDCKIRQCFYVTICYAEEPHEYTTPLMPACGPSPKECEPTRIRETVRFDVLTELPHTPSPLEELEKRLEKCFALLTTGPFAAALKSEKVTDAITKGSYDPPALWNEFCKLRVWLLRYLDSHPDHYNCTIREDINAIECPAPPKGDYKAGEEQYAQDTTYGATVVRALCRLLELAYQHVMACVFGELTTFSCEEPPHASCIVLGTVEVEDDRVVRVCNCPRSYVWSFASFFQVLIASLLGPLACETVEQRGHEQRPHYGHEHGHSNGCRCGNGDGRTTCCAEFKLEDCKGYLSTLLANGCAASDVATAPLQVIKSLRQLLQSAFDPTRTDVLSWRRFLGKPVQEVEAMVDPKQQVSIREVPAQPPAHDLLLALGGALPQTATSPLALYQSLGRIVGAVPQPEIYARLDRIEPEITARISKLEAEIENLKRQVPRRGGPPPESPPPPPPTRSRPRGGGPA